MQRFIPGLLPLVLCLSATASANEQSVPTDPLQQPALHSQMAPRALILDVTKAGDAVVAVGERGFILRSEDEGQSWQQVEVPVSVTLTRVDFPTSDQGWAIGHAGTILHSDDSGLSWKIQLDGRQAARLVLEEAEQRLTAKPGQAAERRLRDAKNLMSDGPDKPFLAVHFSDAKRGLAVGAYGLAFATEDGGATWQPADERLDNPGALHLYAIESLGTDLFIAGEQGLLLRSRDGGTSFQALDSPASGTLFGLVAIGQKSLLAYGLRGKAYLSEDGGDSWQSVPNPQPITLTAGTRLSDGRVLLLDESGRMLASGDPRRGFSTTALDEPTYLTGLTELADGQLVLSGARGLSRLNLDALNRSAIREQ
ncbi:YCF48-related protein [Pseudomonas mendocina]|uniref:WD40/YVTN/BNR-like repeat-containing protein n=1 Tax=Ectopseudomonas mendocina TaxID=300 RepID=UPI0023DAE91C|nr:YCF48-related protein [Pseudomonas mendocina]MDF2074056.1 YCF48-related protein [Pseudomonas mendocina]